MNKIMNKIVYFLIAGALVSCGSSGGGSNNSSSSGGDGSTRTYSAKSGEIYYAGGGTDIAYLNSEDVLNGKVIGRCIVGVGCYASETGLSSGNTRFVANSNYNINTNSIGVIPLSTVTYYPLWFYTNADKW